MFKKKLFVFAGVLIMVCCICVGISHFMEQKRMEQVQQIEQGDVLIFGKSDSFDGQWLVLDAENTNMGTDGMFLASENLLGSQDGDTLLFRDIGDVSVSFADRGVHMPRLILVQQIIRGVIFRNGANHFPRTI